MEIEIRLRKVLQDHNLDHHGITQEIARAIGVHRHTVSRIYRNQLRNPPLDVLGRICDWLQRNNVPASSLPGDLFGAGARELWRAVAALRAVTLYLGEYQQERADTLVSWISRRDSAVETEFVRWLSIPANCGNVHPIFDTGYVRFRADLGAQRVSPKVFAEDCARARVTFTEMRQKLDGSSAILIGSQRVNYLVECFVADLFGCEPFADPGRQRIPFYMTFPRRVHLVRSCFGSLKNPPAIRGPLRPGTYFLDSDRQWQVCPWIDGIEDSGLVITCYEPGTKSCHFAVFGLTGRATEALGRYLTEHDKDFWPPQADSRRGKVGVYVCHFKFDSPQQGQPGDTAIHDMKVAPLDPPILQEFLKR